MRIFVLFLALLALPGLAQPLGYLPYPNTSYQGVVQQITPGGVVISANGVNMLLPGGLNFDVGGVRVGLGGLAVGAPVTAYIPGGNGQIVGYAQDMVYIQTPQGVIPVPAGQISGENQNKTKVSVLKPNGKVVNVPLHAALNMQRTQGAVILGSRSTPYTPQGPAPGIILSTSGDWCTVQGMQNGMPVLYQVPRNQAQSWVQPWQSWGNGDQSPGNSGKGSKHNNGNNGNNGKKNKKNK